MVLSRRESVIVFVIGFVFIGLLYPPLTTPTYEGTLSGGGTIVSSDIDQGANYSISLMLEKINNTIPDRDYYYIEYFFDDTRYGSDIIVSPCLIEVEVLAASIGSISPTLSLLYSDRSPAPGWIYKPGLLGVGAGSIYFNSDEDGMGHAWAQWNVTGTGGVPLLVHVAGSVFMISLGFAVGESEGINVSVSCNVTWAAINRILGVTQYAGHISLPVLEVTYEP
ncbi:MAG: hypothetical protein EAX87_11385 [Candidatus Thorarchaeota archaeon]|nr:hypothetical protein [Candidatus Thorarchaeota archaeon]